jgi:hypothetical protein
MTKSPYLPIILLISRSFVMSISRRFPPKPIGNSRGPVVCDVAEEDKHSPKEEQTDESEADGAREAVPVRLGGPVLVQVWYLHREVARHEADGQEEDRQLGDHGCAAIQSCYGLRILLLREVEVLRAC